MKTKMNYGASGVIFGRAKALRDRQTYAEKLLWSRLRNNQLGVRFKRQHPLSKFVVDFYCHSHHLVIEVDGDVHLDKTVQIEDAAKLESLLAMDLKVIRFTNQMVITQLEKVIDDIKKELFRISLNPKSV